MCTCKFETAGVFALILCRVLTILRVQVHVLQLDKGLLFDRLFPVGLVLDLLDLQLMAPSPPEACLRHPPVTSLGTRCASGRRPQMPR